MTPRHPPRTVADMSDTVISVKGLSKRYGDVEAVRCVDLEIGRGEIFAFLGPNGAGKTTTVEILEGYRSRTAGIVSVLGVDPAHASSEWRGGGGGRRRARLRPPPLAAAGGVGGEPRPRSD